MALLEKIQPSISTQPPAFIKVRHEFPSAPDQHQAVNLLRMTQGLMIAALLGISLLFTDGTSPSLFDLSQINVTEVALFVALISSLLTLVAVARLLDRGNLRAASQVFVLDLLAITSLVYFVHLPTNAAIIGFSAPLVAAGVLLNRREVSLTGIGLAAIITGSVVLHGLGILTIGFQLAPDEVVIFSTIVLLLDVIMLQTFSASRVMLLEERLRLIGELRVLNQQLEQRVQERTRDLQVAADVSLQITTQLDSAQLLTNVVEQTTKAFGLYHVAIFLYDDETKLLRLKQGVGAAGEQMVALGKQFRLTDQGLVPSAGHSRQAALANDVTQNSLHSVNPLLPATRSELAIPIIYGGLLIGVLDFQSQQVNRFREEDLRILHTLADQIAIAIRNSQLFEETTAAKEQAERADKVKSAFLASMSHELRTPLNAIINFAKFLKKGIPGPVNQEQEELIGSIADSGQHLLNLINDVLDMSKIEAGSLKLYVESNIDLRQIIETALQYTQPLLADKPVDLRQDFPDDLPLLTGDRKRLLQIFLNILSNACKFTEEGQVQIQVRHEAEHLLISIEDTGAGIAPEDAEYVFTAFKQTESGLRQGGGGTGLGMPICQKLVEAHEGRIWFESRIGVGTTFFVELPIHTNLVPERSKQHA